MVRSLAFLLVLSIAVPFDGGVRAESPPAQPEESAVTFHAQVRPILQRYCQGCHQPAQRRGGLDLTSFAGLSAGGDSGPAIVPGEAEQSPLYLSLLEDSDFTRMPMDGDPLPDALIAKVQGWIDSGAVDDSPPAFADPISPENPPTYEAEPLVTALAFSPDGEFLAVGGYREILLHRADGTELIDRLIGLSQRIESIEFSPDGSRLAAVGGSPGRFGELQIWNLASRELELSSMFTYDTLFGVTWSSDGKLLAFGAGDSSARVVQAETGDRLLKLDHHTDWVLGAAFSLDDAHLVTVSRDRAVKLTLVESGSFIDNVTSITPGALTGGLEAIERHPTRNEVLVGGIDGVPKLYRIFRTKARRIGDDFNLVRAFEKAPGTVSDVAFDVDGSLLAIATSDSARVYRTDDAGKVAVIPFEHSVYAVDFHPTNGTLAAAGYDGVVKIAEASSGTLVREFVPVPFDATEDAQP